MKKFFLIILLTLTASFVYSGESPKTETIYLDSGPICGIIEDPEGEIREYFGIPYAAPPVGKLRWKDPQSVIPWTDILTCDTFRDACPQPKGNPITADNMGNSEDCLYLNIWAPEVSENESSLPVMVWIHGGAWTYGSGRLPIYNGFNFAKKGVILVTINYRLGPFGFLVHEWLDEECPPGRVSGNYGFLDQIEALKWVQKNIAAFGGDPNNITIFGESAGAFCIAYHLLSPLSDGLFQKAIMESGAPYGYWITFPDSYGPRNLAIDMGFSFRKTLMSVSGRNAGKNNR